MKSSAQVPLGHMCLQAGVEVNSPSAGVHTGAAQEELNSTRCRGWALSIVCWVGGLSQGCQSKVAKDVSP